MSYSDLFDESMRAIESWELFNESIQGNIMVNPLQEKIENLREEVEHCQETEDSYRQSLSRGLDSEIEEDIKKLANVYFRMRVRAQRELDAILRDNSTL